jgi:hypothetical protein
VEVEFFIHGEPLRLVFDPAAVRGRDVERANDSEMHRKQDYGVARHALCPAQSRG